MSPQPLPFRRPRPLSSVLSTPTFSISSSPMSFCSVSPVRNLSLRCSALSSPSYFASFFFSPVFLFSKNSVRVSRDVPGIRHCCHAVEVDDHRIFCSSPLLSTVISYPLPCSLRFSTSLMGAEDDCYPRRDNNASFVSKPCVIIVDHDHPSWLISYRPKFDRKDHQNVYRRHLLLQQHELLLLQQRRCTRRRGTSAYGGGGGVFSTWTLKRAASFSLSPSLHFSARSFSSCDASSPFASYLPTLSSNAPLCVSSPPPSASSLVSSSSLASSSTSSSSSVSLSSSVASFIKSSSPSCRFGSSSTSTSSAYSSIPACALGHSPLALPCEAFSFASSSGSLSPVISSPSSLSFASAVCPASLPSPSLSSTCSVLSSSCSLTSSLQSGFVSSSLSSLSSSSSISSFPTGSFRVPHLLRHVSILRAFGISSADCEYICSQHFSLMSSSTLMTTSSQFEEFQRLVEYFISCGMTVAHIRELLIINPEVFFCSDFEAIRRRVVDLVNCGVPPEDFADLLRHGNAAEVNGEGEEGKSKIDRITQDEGSPQPLEAKLSKGTTTHEVELSSSSSSSSLPSNATTFSIPSVLNVTDTEKPMDNFSLPLSFSHLSSSESFPSSSRKNTSGPSVGRIFKEHKFPPSLCSKVLQIIDHHRVFPPAFLEDLSVSLRFLRNALQNDELLNLRLANFPQLFEDNVRKLIFPRVSFLRFIETNTPNTSDCYNHSNTTSSSKGSTTSSVLKSSSFHDLFGTSEETFVVKVACRSVEEYQNFLKVSRISSFRGPDIGGNRSVDLNGCAQESERLNLKSTCSNSSFVTKSKCESNKSSNSNHDMKGACLNSVVKNLHTRISMKQEELEKPPPPSLPPSFCSPLSSITSSSASPVYGSSSNSVPPSTVSSMLSSCNSSSLDSSSPLLSDAVIPVVTSSTFSSPPSPASSCAAALVSSSSSVSSHPDADDASLDLLQFLRKYFHGTTEKHLSELKSNCYFLDNRYLRTRLKLMRENLDLTNIWALQRFLRHSPEMINLNWRVVIPRLNVLKMKHRISQGIILPNGGKSTFKREPMLGFLMRCSPIRFCQLMDIDIKYFMEEIEKERRKIGKR